jgi:anaerobic glycerol-3-phosphate dehydrogenase
MSETKFVTILLAIALAIVTAISIYGVKQSNALREQCEAKGGVLISGGKNGNAMCIKKDAVIEDL